MTNAQQLWERCAATIRSQVSEATWRTWFASVSSLDLRPDELRLSVPNLLVKERLESRFATVLREALGAAGGGGEAPAAARMQKLGPVAGVLSLLAVLLAVYAFG